MQINARTRAEEKLVNPRDLWNDKFFAARKNAKRKIMERSRRLIRLIGSVSGWLLVSMKLHIYATMRRCVNVVAYAGYGRR